MVQPHLGPSHGREVLIPAFFNLSDPPRRSEERWSDCRRWEVNHGHTLRRSFATHLPEGGTNLRIIQDLLRHKSARTTQICTHVARSVIESVRSPLDNLD